MGKYFKTKEEYEQENIFCDNCGLCLTDADVGDAIDFDPRVAIIDDSVYCFDCLERLTLNDWLSWAGIGYSEQDEKVDLFGDFYTTEELKKWSIKRWVELLGGEVVDL